LSIDRLARPPQRWMMSAIAASLAAFLIGGGAGWFMRGASTSPTTFAEFTGDALGAHRLYVVEVRHPVEVEGSERAHLQQWLSKRVGYDVKAPELDGTGLKLVGGRLLPGETGARAQFMFEDTAGERVTLYIGTLDANAAGAAAARETAFRFASEGPVPSFYWVDQGFGFALAGKLPRELLLKLATLAYRDLS
jgi:anti-sigma factor RsiW